MSENVRLSKMTSTSGCAAKLGPDFLMKALEKLPRQSHEKLLVGFDTNDDAAVYQLSDDIAIIETLDFFTPMVDDPYTFGLIAAANALSDVYAMGGIPLLALNIVGFPSKLSIDILEDILKGGNDKVREAGAIIAGGHSIDDIEPKYGLAVTGTVHPKKILTNKGVLPGDVLLLTKPLGTGIINTAFKAEMIEDNYHKAAVQSMMTLNKAAAETARGFDIHACTDVTGFGLAGHAYEMASASKVDIHILISSLIYFDGVLECARMGLVPGGTYRNRNYLNTRYKSERIDEALLDLIFDPQTSGGLLFSVDEVQAPRLLHQLTEQGIHAFICGYATASNNSLIIVE